MTSDGLIQLSALRSGILRTSAAEFEKEVEQVNDRIAQLLHDLRSKPARMQQVIIRPRKPEKEDSRHGS